MIAVTGATGNLGGLVIEELLDCGVESSNIVAAVHSSEKTSDLADADTGIAEGYLYVEWDDLSRLIGPPTTPLSEAVADALQVE